MGEANMLVMPDIVFIGSTVLLESIHALQHSGIGVAKHTGSDIAAGFPRFE